MSMNSVLVHANTQLKLWTFNGAVKTLAPPPFLLVRQWVTWPPFRGNWRPPPLVEEEGRGRKRTWAEVMSGVYQVSAEGLRCDITRSDASSAVSCSFRVQLIGQCSSSEPRTHTHTHTHTRLISSVETVSSSSDLIDVNINQPDFLPAVLGAPKFLLPRQSFVLRHETRVLKTSSFRLIRAAHNILLFWFILLHHDTCA